MITSTISVPELVWTIATAIGFFSNGRQLTRAIGDYFFVRHNKINSIREYAAVTTILMFASWTVVQLVFVLIGAIAMAVSNANNVITPVQYATLIGFVSISVLLGISGYIIDIRRRNLIEKIKEIEDGI